MEESSDESVKKRIEKSQKMFYENISKISSIKDEKMLKVIELSKMYASDSKSYFYKGDLYTSFSCIEYAYGLLDAILMLNGEK